VAIHAKRWLAGIALGGTLAAGAAGLAACMSGSGGEPRHSESPTVGAEENEPSDVTLREQLKDAGYAEYEDDEYEYPYLRSPDKRIAISLLDDRTIAGADYAPNFVAEPGRTYNETVATHPEYENGSIHADFSEVNNAPDLSLEAIIEIVYRAHDAMREKYEATNPTEGYLISAIELDINGETYTLWCDYTGTA
jgi:hypothetical protein